MTSKIFTAFSTVGLLVFWQLIGDQAVAQSFAEDSMDGEAETSDGVQPNEPTLSPLIEPATEPPAEQPATETETPPAEPSTEPFVEQTESPPVENQQQKEEYLDLVEARNYALELINADRCKARLQPVRLDKIANKAGQWHSDELARDGYSNHWNREGMKPPQRYSVCGGMDYVGENSLGTSSPGTMGWSPKPAKDQLFTRSEILRVHNTFMNSPGHRKNVMEPEHTHVGLGFTLVDLVHENGYSRNRDVTCAQEFINKYGIYQASSNVLVRNLPYRLGGAVQAPLKIYSIMVKREDLPTPIPPEELNSNKKYAGSYSLPDKTVTDVFPDAYTHTREAKLVVDGQNFALTIIPSASWKPGLYYTFLWVSDPKGKEFVISMRVLELR